MIGNLSPLQRSSIAGIAGFVAYGGWAYFANSGHGEMIALRSGAVQGFYSLVLTFVMTLVTEWMFSRLRTLIVTTVVVSVLLFVSAYVIHMIVGTPEILMTIMPGWVIGTVYTSVYVWGLRRGSEGNGTVD